MLSFAIKSSTRTFLRYRLLSGMSLLSLIFGALCTYLVLIWVKNESTMDAFHENLDRIHLTTFRTNPMADQAPMPLKLFFDLDLTQYPQVEKTSLVHVYRENEIKMITADREFGGKALVIDSAFFDIFSFAVEGGVERQSLLEPSNVILSEHFARKVFGDENPIGKTVEVRCDQVGVYQVAAVLEKIPSNSSITFDFLVPRHSQRFWRRIPQEIFLATESFNGGEFNALIADEGRSDERFPESVLGSIPLSSVYFDRPFDISLFTKYGNRANVYTMTFIGAVLLLLTTFGFLGIQAILQANARKKVGIKMALGASNPSLITEMLVSRTGYIVVATMVGLVLLNLIFPFYTRYIEVELDQSPGLATLGLATIISGIVLVATIVSIWQSVKVKATQALSKDSPLLKTPTFQRYVTTIQYGITIALIVATAVVFIQFQFMTTKDIGLDHKEVISVDFFEIASRNREEREKMAASHEYVKGKFSMNPDVFATSQGDLPVNLVAEATSWKREAAGFEYTTQNRLTVDPGYGDVLGIEVLQGRFFDELLDKPREQKVVINEAAMRHWQIEDIANAKLASNTNGRQEFTFEIIGVVKDFHYEHLTHSIKPLVLVYQPYMDENFLVKFAPGKEAEMIEFLSGLFKDVNPKGVFDYELLEDRVQAQYVVEKRIGKVYFAFTLIALLISSMGLFTFSLHEIKRRTKEIGIRKVTGASNLHVFSLLSGSFLRAILIAFLFASPIAWYLMNGWLSGFANRVEVPVWVLVAAGAIALMVGMAAITWQTLAVARKNPVDSLRYE